MKYRPSPIPKPCTNCGHLKMYHQDWREKPIPCNQFECECKAYSEIKGLKLDMIIHDELSPLAFASIDNN